MDTKRKNSRTIRTLINKMKIKIDLDNNLVNDITELALHWGFTTDEKIKNNIGHYKTAVIRECIEKIKEIELANEVKQK